MYEIYRYESNVYLVADIYNASSKYLCILFNWKENRVFGGIHKVNSNEKHSRRCQDRKPNSFVLKQNQPFQMDHIKCWIQRDISLDEIGIFKLT